MLRIPDLGRAAVRRSAHSSLRLMGLAAAALLALSAATSERAQALSPINPGAAATANVAADGLTIEVRGGGHGGGGHGGGGHGFGGHGLAGGSFHSGVAHYGGFGHGGHRFGHRHHFGRFFAGGYYYDDYPYYDYPYYAYPGCRVVLTDVGPRRICGYRSWRHHHYRRHHHRRHHRVHR
jgi:hypothetical protein